eukprot:1752786-Rhodomonas_salina.3
MAVPLIASQVRRQIAAAEAFPGIASSFAGARILVPGVSRNDRFGVGARVTGAGRLEARVALGAPQNQTPLVTNDKLHFQCTVHQERGFLHLILQCRTMRPLESNGKHPYFALWNLSQFKAGVSTSRDLRTRPAIAREQPQSRNNLC